MKEKKISRNQKKSVWMEKKGGKIRERKKWGLTRRKNKWETKKSGGSVVGRRRKREEKN